MAFVARVLLRFSRGAQVVEEWRDFGTFAERATAERCVVALSGRKDVVVARVVRAEEEETEDGK